LLQRHSASAEISDPVARVGLHMHAPYGLAQQLDLAELEDPFPSTIKKLAAALGVDPEALMEPEDP
jgi:hypothetical protein